MGRDNNAEIGRLRFKSRVLCRDRYNDTEVTREELFLYNDRSYALETEASPPCVIKVSFPSFDGHPIFFPFILFIFHSVVSFTTGHHLVVVVVVNIVAW